MAIAYLAIAYRNIIFYGGAIMYTKQVKYVLLLPVLMTLVLLGVFGLGSKAGITEPETIQVGLIKGPTGIGAVYVVKNPVLDAKSINIQLLPGVDAVTAKILTGELDFAVLPVNVAAKLYNSGIDYPVLAVIGDGMVQILSNNNEITSFTDLVGKTVYVAGQGATPEYLIRTIARSYTIPVYTQNESKPDGITLMFSMPYPEMAAALAAGRIESAVLPEPFATVARMNNIALKESFSIHEAWNKATGMSDYPMTVLVGKESFVKQFPKLTAKFLQYYEKSIQTVIANPQEAGQFAEELGFGLKAGIVKASIPRSNYVFIPAESAKLQISTLLNVFLKEAPESIGGKLPDTGFYYSIQ